MAKANDPKDPRFRRFRTAVYAVYLVIVGVFSALVIFSVFRSVRAMTPKAATESETVLTVRECLDGANTLWQRLDDERKGFSAKHPANKVDQDFMQFRVTWLRDLRDLQARCAVQSHNRTELRDLFVRLERVENLYMTHSVQYAGEIGPAVDKLDASFEAVRKSERSGGK